MLVVCWSPKGGSGTSVVTAALGIAAARGPESSPTIIVDLDGDMPSIFGMAEPAIGVSEWISQPSTHELDDLLVESASNLHILPRGSAQLPDARSGAWSRLGLELAGRSASGTTVVVDGAYGPVPHSWEHHLTHSVLVVRPCYLALRRARTGASTFDTVVAVIEPNRVLTSDDIASVLGAPVAATIPVTSDIARRVDAGVLFQRPPAQLLATLSPLIDRWRSE